MTIPFIHLYPNGRRSLSEIERPEPIEDVARKCIAHGVEYYVGILPSGQAKVQAVRIDETGEREGDAEVCDNGPALLEAVDRVILTSQILLVA